MVTVPGDLAWRLPFALQWVWPIPLMIGTYFAPESPWNAVRRGKLELARKSLLRVLPNTPDKESRADTSLAYIQYTTSMEKAESEGASFFDCFRGINRRRTEIVSNADTIWMQLTCSELRRLGSANSLW